MTCELIDPDAYPNPWYECRPNNNLFGLFALLAIPIGAVGFCWYKKKFCFDKKGDSPSSDDGSSPAQFPLTQPQDPTPVPVEDPKP